MPYEHEFASVDSTPNPTLFFEDPSEIIGIVISDSLFVLHRHIASEIPLICKKIEHKDTFQLSLWGYDIECMHCTVPSPYSFPTVVLDLYGCCCNVCMQRDERMTPRELKSLLKLCDYLGHQM